MRIGKGQRERERLDLVLTLGHGAGGGVDPAVERVAEHQPEQIAAGAAVGPVPWRRSEPTASPRRTRTPTMSVAWPMATSPMPSTLPPSSWIGRTVASSTSTTRLAFSCMTPMRIQVLYCVQHEEDQDARPITDVALVDVLCCVRSAGFRPGRAWPGDLCRSGRPRDRPPGRRAGRRGSGARTCDQRGRVRRRAARGDGLVDARSVSPSTTATSSLPAAQSASADRGRVARSRPAPACWPCSPLYLITCVHARTVGADDADLLRWRRAAVVDLRDDDGGPDGEQG